MTALATLPQTVPLTAQQRMRAIQYELMQQFLERDEIIEAIIVTLLARENGLIFGEPGTGKSDLLEELCRRILGGKYARFLMDRMMDKSEFMGMFDLPRYEQTGEWGRNITDTILDAVVSLIDEVDKCGPAVTTPLLTAINEHMGKPAGQWIPIPLLSAYGAANAPLEPGQEAFGDRFLTWLVSERIKQADNYVALLRSAVTPRKPEHPTTIDLDELMHVVEVEVPAIPVPDAVFEAMYRLRTELEADGIEPSDRRMKKAVRLLQAKAWLEGRDIVEEDDIAILRHVVWSRQEDRAKIAAKVLTYTGPVTRLAIKLMSAVAEHRASIDELVAMKESMETRASHGGRMQAAIREMQGQLDAAYADARSKGRNTSRLDEVQQEIKELHVQVYVVCMNTPEAGARRLIGV